MAGDDDGAIDGDVVVRRRMSRAPLVPTEGHLHWPIDGWMVICWIQQQGTQGAGLLLTAGRLDSNKEMVYILHALGEGRIDR